MKKAAKKMFHIHLSDWRLSLFSLFLLSLVAMATGLGVGLALTGGASGIDSLGILGGAALVLVGFVCLVVWKRLVWDRFVHHMTDLS